jgi:hypothetical protein
MKELSPEVVTLIKVNPDSKVAIIYSKRKSVTIPKMVQNSQSMYKECRTAQLMMLHIVIRSELTSKIQQLCQKL